MPAVVGMSSFVETFAGVDSSPWDTGRWTTGTYGDGVVDLQGNQGHIHVEGRGAGFGIATGMAPTADAEVLASFRFDETATDAQSFHWLRASGDWADPYNLIPTSGYGVQIYNTRSKVKVFRADGGGARTLIGSVTNVAEVTTARQWVRYQVEGNHLRIKIWTDGTTEPADWEIELTDATHTGNGRYQIGFSRSGGNTPRNVYFDDLNIQGATTPPPNVAPVAVDDGSLAVPIEVDQDTATGIDVLGNDSDSDGTLVPGSVTVTGGPSNGGTTVDPVTGEITYTPNTLFLGADQFTYSVDDNDGDPSNQATVYLNVTVADGPVTKPELWEATQTAVEPAYQSLWNGLYSFIPFTESSLPPDQADFHHVGRSAAPFRNGAPFTWVLTPFGYGMKWGDVDHAEGIHIPGSPTAPLLSGSNRDWSLALLFSWDGTVQDDSSLITQQNGPKAGNGLRWRMEPQASPTQIEAVGYGHFFGQAGVIFAERWYLTYLEGGPDAAADNDLSIWLYELDTGLLMNISVTGGTATYGTIRTNPIMVGASDSADDPDGITVVGAWVWDRRLNSQERSNFFADPFGMYRPAAIEP